MVEVLFTLAAVQVLRIEADFFLQSKQFRLVSQTTLLHSEGAGAMRHSPQGSHSSQPCHVTDQPPQTLITVPAGPTASWVSSCLDSQTDSGREA